MYSLMYLLADKQSDPGLRAVIGIGLIFALVAAFLSKKDK